MIKGGKKLLNPLVATQNFEYKVCVLDLKTVNIGGWLIDVV